MEAQVRHRLGEDTPELAVYHKTYEREFNRKWTPCSNDDLWHQIDQSRIVLMGDFHALKQSQKAQLRILRKIPTKRSVVLAVEFFEAADQASIDKFISGKISEKDFLKAVKWEERWGFPWENYRPLVRWAQKNKIPLYGINRAQKKKNAASLKSRDVFAGKKIAELARQHQDSLVFVIYGDLHLAQSHIPQEIIKSLGKPAEKTLLRIFQNAEGVYFQLLARELEASTDVVKISQRSFCLMSVPPWVKWQNYLLYLEQTYDEGLSDDDDDDDDDDALDYTDHIGRYVKLVSEELGHPVSTSALSVYTAQDSHFWPLVKEKYEERRLKAIEQMIADDMSFYLPEIGVAYLARGTVNHAASLAMQYVHAHICGLEKTFVEMPQDFTRRIWLEGIAYFGSKIINHKRKTDTIIDIKASLASKAPVDHAKEAMTLALAQKMHELMVITGVSKHRLQAVPRRKWSYMTAAGILGGMMGERLYFGYRQKLISQVSLLSFLKKPLESESFSAAYYEMLEVIEALPAPFESKKEKL
jgi:uncharacterized iron-regulated protein